MRYLPLTETDRRAMLAAIGASSVDELFATCPPRHGCRQVRSVCPTPGRARGRARLPALCRRKTVAAGSVPFFLGAGAYRHHVPGDRRPPDPAQRVPHLLHALPARDRAGHAAGPLRVPDPGARCSPAWRWPTPRCTTAPPRAAEAVLMAAGSPGATRR